MVADRHGNECAHRLQVRIYTLAAISFDYTRAVTFAEQLYGSNGIYFQIVHQSCLALTAAQQTSLSVIDGTCEWDQNNSEQDDLHDLVDAPESQLCIFIVGDIATPSGSLAGCAGHAPRKPAAVVSGQRASNFTLAHEVGHVLLTSTFSPVHATSTANVMFSPTGSIPVNSSPGFTAAQVTKIKASPLLRAA